MERDKKGNPVTQWGGRTKLHPITGEQVPDETDRVLILRPVGPKAAEWPEAEFIIGNPPFIAGKDLRAELGSGYVEALWTTYPKVPRSADIALFWWWKAARALHTRPRHGQNAPPYLSIARRFGLISSNSLRQAFSRRVLADAMEAKYPIHLVFAIPDHPWSDAQGAAAVRIAMTVAEAGAGNGTLATVITEKPGEDVVPEVLFNVTRGRVNPDLTIGINSSDLVALRASESLSHRGVNVFGAGFIVSAATGASLGLGGRQA